MKIHLRRWTTTRSLGIVIGWKPFGYVGLDLWHLTLQLHLWERE